MVVLRNRAGQVRLVWLLLLVAPFIVAAYLPRYVPIRVRARAAINQGLSRSSAVARARYLFLEDPVGSCLVGTIRGLLWYPLICFLVSAVERRSCTLRDLGLVPGGRGLHLIPFGVVLAFVLGVAYFWVGGLFGRPPFSWSPASLSPFAIPLLSLNFVTNGFGEENAFRAYSQDRLVQWHGLWTGVGLASSVFVLLHLLIYRYSGLVLIAGILPAVMFGTLYLWTGSIYLVGTMHAVFNLVRLRPYRHAQARCQRKPGAAVESRGCRYGRVPPPDGAMLDPPATMGLGIYGEFAGDTPFLSRAGVRARS